MGNNMRAERVRKGLTQTELANTLGVTQITVSRWESGECEPSAKSLVSMTSLYGCSAEYLLDMVDLPNDRIAPLTTN